MEVQDRYLVLFCLFSVVGRFEWFWMESLHSNIQLMTDTLKAPFLVLHFLYYALMTFLMMLSVILLFMLIILLYTLSLIMHLIFGNKWSWLLNLNLICETLKWDRKWLVNFNTEKSQLISFDQSNNTGAIDVKVRVSSQGKIIF